MSDSRSAAGSLLDFYFLVIGVDRPATASFGFLAVVHGLEFCAAAALTGLQKMDTPFWLPQRVVTLLEVGVDHKQATAPLGTRALVRAGLHVFQQQR